MSPNQDLNEQVAKRLGWFKIENGAGKRPEYKEGDGCADVIPDYTGSIAAAWEIVEHLPLLFSLIRRDDGKFVCTFLSPEGLDGGGAHDTAPLAIVKAFLKLP